jgi:hypothetical protein
MPSSDPPFDERRHDNALVDWRMKNLEDGFERLQSQFGSIQLEVSREFAKLGKDVNNQFSDLRKELFEKPVFVTVQWMALELNHRDTKLAELNQRIEDRSKDSVSSKRFTITTAITFISVLIALGAIFIRS